MTDGLVLVDCFATDLQNNVFGGVLRAGDDAGFETPAPESLDTRDQGKPGVTLSWQYMPVDVTVHYDNDWDELERALTVSFDAGALQSSTWESEGQRDEFMERVIDLVCSLTVSNGFEYVAAHDPVSTDGDPVIPAIRPIIDDIDRLPVFGIYSRDMVEILGGRDRVLETPAWRVEELDGGQILIVTDEAPWDQEGCTANATEYLLSGGENTSSSPSEPGLSDPFAALEPGDYGTDVCVRREDIAAEFHNEDIELVRVYVDENKDLRRVSDDSFVRNVVVDAPDDATFIQRMLIDIPSEATEDIVMVSALLHGSIPPSFVRLDEPNGKNIVARIMALNVETNKIDMLVSLGKAVQHQEGIDIGMIESALDNLADLEDVEGIERYIQQNLL